MQSCVITLTRTFEGPRVRDYVLSAVGCRSPWKFDSLSEAEKKIRLMERIPYVLTGSEVARPRYRIEPDGASVEREPGLA